MLEAGLEDQPRRSKDFESIYDDVDNGDGLRWAYPGAFVGMGLYGV